MDKSLYGCVYKITCLKNNKVYIGQSINFKRRVWEHKNLLRNNKHKNRYLQEDFNKYGEDSFKFTLLKDNLSLKDRRLQETKYIHFYGGIENDNVYNYQDNITENIEMRRLVSENQRGKVIKQESIEKMKISLTGRKLSEEHKRKIKESCTKFIGDSNPSKRPEVRELLSKKLSGKGNGMYGKRKYNDSFIQQLRDDYKSIGVYKRVAVKYGISVEVATNLIKYGETFNPSFYYKKRKM